MGGYRARVSAVDHGWLSCSPRVSAVDHGFEPRSGQTKDYKLVCVASPLSTQHSGKRATTGWPGIRIMFPSGVTYLPADCCLSELALQNPTQHVGLEQSGPYHHLIEH